MKNEEESERLKKKRNRTIGLILLLIGVILIPVAIFSALLLGGIPFVGCIVFIVAGIILIKINKKDEDIEKPKGIINRIKRNKVKILSVLAVIFLILVSLNLYGRQWFDPSGSDTVNFNQEDLKPGRNTVEYLSEGDKIVAHLYLPDNYTTNETYPAIVITPPNTGVKEQTAGLYAEKLSKNGFITLVFDPRGFGESGGHPLLLDSLRQVDDAKNSIDFISTLEQVDKDNIFNMGMCVGSSISTYETAFDSRIKAQAMMSPVFTSVEERRSILPIPPDVIYIIAGFAKLQYAITGNDIEFGPIVQELTEEEADEASVGVGMMAEYYLPGKPGDVPNWKNSVSMLSLASMVEGVDFFDRSLTDRFDSIPVYMVYGTEAFSKDGAIRFYDMLNGPKDRLILEGAGHFDIYWMPEYVDPAVEGITEFLNKYIEEGE